MFWRRGEPNDHHGKEDCGEAGKDGSWNDSPCSKKQASVCKKHVPVLESERPLTGTFSPWQTLRMKRTKNSVG